MIASESDMRHRARWRVPLLLTPILALSACLEPAPVENHELTGYVTVLHESADEGGPIGGARVTFTSDTLIVEETTADENGRYRLRVETDHVHGQVRAEAPGFRTHEETVYFDGPQRRVDLALRRQTD